MKNVARIALALSALALAAPAAAQQSRPTLGLGVSIVPVDAAGVLPPIEVYVPIRIAPNFKLEPSLGIWTRDQGGVGANDTRDLVLGLGAFFVKPIAGAADMYVGGRLKLNFAKTDDGTTSNSDTDIVVAAALGGEYYLVPLFSIGLEAQLGLYQRGTAGDFGADDDGFFTTGLGFLRLYF
ncbi:MAG TPA: outer membrane beta-barrel protein [Anaeromyxobacter sp.]|nr:outer membrane beta-barrel protein [Anaeromyxobacter sp.]